ncbi:MAG: 4Fe-4S binding protein [Chloroflexi bacterium]|nr:4Fe-4S binding protein [Chloroflexota bacterium]
MAMRRILASPLYPGVFQLASLLVFGLVVYFGLFGTPRPAYNFATVVTWTLWWPLLPLSFFLAGRAWCAICPIVPGVSLTQRVARPRHMPGPLLRRYGIWAMGLLFVFLTWADRTWAITSSPRSTALLLLALLGMAVAVALVYQRRAFCRYLCPIGALSGLYAMTAVVELRSRDRLVCQGCAQQCYRGEGAVGGCPLFQYVKTLDTNRNCNLCGQCVKTCARGAVELRLRPPAREIWQFRHPLQGEALLAVILVGIVFVQTVDMTTVWGRYMRWLMEATGIGNYNLLFTLTFLVVLGLVGGAYLLVTRGGGAGHGQTGLAFGYAYIPLALTAHLGHNSTHLLGEGPNAVRTAFRAVGSLLTGTPVAVPQGGGLVLSQVWMLPLIILGGVGSLYVAWRIGKRMQASKDGVPYRSHLVFLVVLTVLFVVLFMLPMNPRHAH